MGVSDDMERLIADLRRLAATALGTGMTIPYVNGVLSGIDLQAKAHAEGRCDDC